MKHCVWLVTLSVLSACATKHKTPYPIAVHVESDPGVPLAGVAVAANSGETAYSDDTGVAALLLSGSPGDLVQLEVSCPAEHRAADTPVSVLLRPHEPRARPPEFYVACPPLLRRLVVAVRAQHGAQVPLRFLGRELTRTDSQGFAHVLLTAAPGETLRLTLDTTAPEHAQLMPQQPELRVTMPERDEIVVFDQAFSRPKPKARARIRNQIELPQRL